MINHVSMGILDTRARKYWTNAINDEIENRFFLFRTRYGILRKIIPRIYAYNRHKCHERVTYCLTKARISRFSLMSHGEYRGKFVFRVRVCRRNKSFVARNVNFIKISLTRIELVNLSRLVCAD